MPLGGYGDELTHRFVFVGRASLGDISVDAFFAISGFLITRSALANSVPRYLWQRFLRIYPGYWGCIIVTAMIIAPIAWFHDHGDLGSLLHARTNPVHYVLANAPIVGRWMFATIAGTPAFPATWNGSLWTLPCELECYLVVCGLLMLGIISNRRVVTTLTALLYALASIHVLASGVVDLPSYETELRLVPIFACGALVALWSDRLPDSAWIALASFVLFLVGIHLPNPHLLAGPALAYLTIWLGAHLPFDRVAARTDISYGVYIYAWPIQVLLTVFGVQKAGYAAYVALTFAVVIPVSLMSWLLIEKPALARKKWTPRFFARGVEPSMPAGPTDPR